MTKESSRVIITKIAGDIGDCLQTNLNSSNIDVKGKEILLKPNFVNNDPLVTTSLDLLENIIIELIVRGADKLTIAEGSLHHVDTNVVYQSLGVDKLCRRYDVELIDLKSTKRIRVDSGYEPLKHFEIPALYFETEYLISIPVFKTHSNTIISGTLKNMKGFIDDASRIKMHDIGVCRSLAEMNRFLIPDYSIVDGTKGIEGYGPFSDMGKPRKVGLILSGDDALAVDSTICRIMGFEPEYSEHLRLCGDMQLGTFNPSIIGEEIGDVAIKDYVLPPFSKDMIKYSDNITIIGDSCSSCYAVLGRVLRYIENVENKLNFHIGKNIAPIDIDVINIGFGDCAIKSRNRYDLEARGCPPRGHMTAERIQKLLCE